MNTARITTLKSPENLQEVNSSKTLKKKGIYPISEVKTGKTKKMRLKLSSPHLSEAFYILDKTFTLKNFTMFYSNFCKQTTRTLLIKGIGSLT